MACCPLHILNKAVRLLQGLLVARLQCLGARLDANAFSYSVNDLDLHLRLKKTFKTCNADPWLCIVVVQTCLLVKKRLGAAVNAIEN